MKKYHKPRCKINQHANIVTVLTKCNELVVTAEDSHNTRNLVSVFSKGGFTGHPLLKLVTHQTPFSV